MSDIHRRLPRLMPARYDAEKVGKGMLAFRSRKADVDAGKSSGMSVPCTRKRANETPEEVYLSPRKQSPAQLPEKFALLESFYDGVEAAISLLGIRRQLCTFQAVCSTVEATTKRRFLQKHLAQIKYILPEAVHLEYVRSYDQESRIKRWELKVSLLPLPAAAEEPSVSGGCTSKRPKIESVQRRLVFHSRLVKLAATLPEDDDIPAHPMPERIFNGNSKGANTGLPAATTCIPMEINTAAHRVEMRESSDGSTCFTKSVRPGFSQMTASSASSLMESDKAEPQKSSLHMETLDTILPMPINRTSHRDVHNLAEKPTGTPHLAPSFRPFFSVKNSVPETELGCGISDDCAVLSDMTSSSVQLTPIKRRHAGLQEESEVEEPVELQTPVKVFQTYGTPKRTTACDDSPSKRLHLSPSLKSHYSNCGSPLSHSLIASRSLQSTPVKPSVSKDVSISWDLRTPGSERDGVDRYTPIGEDSVGAQTPVKSSIQAHTFKSPAPLTPKHQYTPCTPQNSERGRKSLGISYHVDEPINEGIQSPAATPVKGSSTIRSLNFHTPKAKSYSKDSSATGSPCPRSPTMGTQTPVNFSRASGFRMKAAVKHSKLDLRPLFARTNDEDVGKRDGAESLSKSCETGATETPSSTNSLSLGSRVSQADLNMIQGLPAELVNSVIKEELRVAEEKSSDVVAVRRRQQMMAGLPNLFNQLCLIFQSSNKSVFPYKDLLAKIVSSNTEMTDRVEVEERLKMLTELAPEWISAKKSLTGDTLYRINKKADVMTVRRRLCGAQ
ncbi:uncharacterized protein [Physcomitrium patens]|uniref:CDT1 Geminin-binding domain-containing protein n=1 Tax=Physcomitrium patens TaxID=3218 RepID=A0A2K1IYE8_PHYPA|nr:CDT1-like protein a, chloroplastic [Physcomitrium patens]PNR34294.1 hypothetical protein PHYPA_024111 [Physcomitrium patens]|eukprot:XP_024356720.1 CDT1-like protein a, chloroplastic [Physcomitrella patens]